MKFYVISLIAIVAMFPAVIQAQCQNDYSGTNTGLACEVSVNGNASITQTDGEGNSETLKRGKAKRILRREERQLKRLRNQTSNLLKRTRRLNTDGSVSDSKAATAITAVSTSVGSILENSPTQILGDDTIREARVKLRSIRSDARQAIRANKRTRRLLKSCKRSRCECETRTVAASMVFEARTNPAAQNACQAYVLARWSSTETENAGSVEVFYTWLGAGDPLRSKVGTPPYDDVYSLFDGEVLAGEGMHQLFITRSSKSGTNPNAVVDCSDLSARQQELIKDPYVEAEVCSLVRGSK